MKLGTLIKSAREAQGLSLTELGKRAKVSVSSLSRIENRGQSRVPSTDILGRLSKHLDISPDVLFPAAGRLPPDVAKWILSTPGAIAVVRGKMREAA